MFWGYAVAQLVGALHYKPEGRGYSCTIQFNIIIKTSISSGFSSSGFPTKSVYAFIFLPYVSCPAHLVILDLITLRSDKKYES